MRRAVIAVAVLVICVFFLIGANDIETVSAGPMASYYIANAYEETGAENAITSIYLYYRYYDTMFETMMLLLSIIGVIYMSVHKGEEYNG